MKYSLGLIPVFDESLNLDILLISFLWIITQRKYSNIVNPFFHNVEYRKIFKVCLTILQHYEKKKELKNTDSLGISLVVVLMTFQCAKYSEVSGFSILFIST